MSLADQASLLLIPSGYKSQKVYSIFPTDGDGDFDFSRSGSATRIAKNGLITTVDSNIPRLEYPMIDGVQKGCPSLILEPQRTNVCGYSDDFTQWSLTNGTLSSNSVISPDGTLNADKVVFNNIALDLKRTVTVTASTTYTFSFYIKLESGNGLQGRFYDNSNSSNIVYYDYSKQVIGTDWTRVTRQVTTPSGCTQMQVWLLAASTSLVTASFWGAQLEVGSYETSYIPTPSASIVTRQAETCNGAGDAATFSDSEGVLMAEIEGTEDGTNKFITISDGSIQNRITIIFLSNNIVAQVRASNSEVFFQSTSGISIENYNKIAVYYKTNQCKLFVNGMQVGLTDTLATMPSGLDTLTFDNGNGVDDFYGNTKQIQYYNSALTESELEKLTSWTSFIDMAQAQQYSIK